MRLSFLLCFCCTLAMLSLSCAGGDELIFFADDHYKVLGGPELQASAVNPLIEPGQSFVLSVSLANNGRIDELIPISGNGSQADIVQEMEEEQRSVDALNITAHLLGDDDISVTSGPSHIDSLPTGSVARMEFNVSAAEAAGGWHDLLLNIDYEHQMDTYVSEGMASPLYLPDNVSQTLRVMVRGSAESVRILGIKSDASPGKSGIIRAVVENSGKDSLRNCTLRLLAVPPFHLAENGCNLGDVMPGAAAVAEFPVDVDANAALQEYHLACEVLHADGKTVLTFPVVLEETAGHGYHYLLLIAVFAIISVVAAILVVRNRQTRKLRRRRLWR
jgi:uncharacterized membrane protein